MKKYSNIILNIVFFVLGIALLYLAFYKQDLRQILLQVQEVDFRWMGAVLLVSVLSHIARAWRWHLLTRSVPISYRVIQLFWAMMLGYLVNLVIPRMGEVSRCLVLSRRSKQEDFAPLLGTVVMERAVDVLSLIMVILMALVLQIDLLFDFFEEYLFTPLWGLFFTRQWLIYGVIVLGAVILSILYLFRNLLLKSVLTRRVVLFFLSLWSGIQSIRRVKQVGLFLVLTIFLWVSYFLTTFLWFFSLPETSHLGISEGLTLLAIGSVARLAPTQGGGLGAFQLLMSKGFALLGVAEIFGITLAIVIHATQIIFTLIVGGFAPIYFMLYREKV